MKGKVIGLNVRTKRCIHVHYSGRRCATRINPKEDNCSWHKNLYPEGDDRCTECRSMKRAFGLPITGD